MTSVRPAFTHSVEVRYLEVDQQGVVFNMWYLAYLDDAMTAYLLAGGLPYTEMISAGYDVQLVHTELDWVGSLGWGDRADIDVSTGRLGTTSFTLDFTVRSGERDVATASTVYVVVGTGGTGGVGKQPIPDRLRAALGDASGDPSGGPSGGTAGADTPGQFPPGTPGGRSPLP